MREMNSNTDLLLIVITKFFLNGALSTVCPGSGVWPVSFSRL